MNIQGKNKDLKLYNKEGVRVYSCDTYSNGYWYECIYDKKGDILTFKDSKGYGSERTYDKKGNLLTYKDSNGYFSKYTYGKKGNLLTYENSNGIKRGFDIPEYTMENLVEKLGDFKLIK